MFESDNREGVYKHSTQRSVIECQNVRISTTEFEKQSKILKNHLCKRGYRVAPVQAAIDEMFNTDRNSLLSYKRKEEGSRVPLVTTYHHALKNINTILKSHLAILYNNERMAKVFKDPPMGAFRRPRHNQNKIGQPTTNRGFHHVH
jgi:hypothetical protein